MWLCTRHGFFSVTRSKEQPSKIQVRARVRMHLENIIPMLEGKRPKVIYTPQADYHYRILLSPGQAQYLLQELAREIDYCNFKDEVAQAMPDDKKYKSALSSVWQIFSRIQLKRPWAGVMSRVDRYNRRYAQALYPTWGDDDAKGNE